MTVSRIHHVGITCADVELSLRFYRDLLGMRVIEDTRLTRPEVAALLGTDEIDLRLVNLDTGDGRILELLEYAKPRGRRVDYTSRDPGTGHVAFEVRDLDAITAGLEAAGGSAISRHEVTAEDTDGIFAHARLLYVRDPDGMILELVQLPDPTHAMGR
jgi:catechol 2,3-dioxygenase-like lactoylglutathione lyase family enzyme